MTDNVCYNKCDISDQVEKLIDMAKTLKTNGNNYIEHGDIKGALYSYSNCASLLYTIKTLFDNMCSSKEEKAEREDMKFVETEEFIYKLDENYQIMLNKVSQLQALLKKTSNKKNDQDVISCKEISNVSLSGSDCIFFNQVIGLEDQKLKIEETFIKPIIYPSLYGELSKGILFYGPPGTGKTLLVKAAVNTLATAYTDNKISVIFFSPTAADLKGKYVGESEKKIKELFVCAHRKACECQSNDKDKYNRTFLSVIFIDEIDNVGASRSNDTTGMMKQTVNALLQAMDGIESSKNVIVMGATNNPWELDSALLRRFTSHIFIDLPKKSNIKKLIEKEIVSYIKKDYEDITKCADKPNKLVKKTCDSLCKEDPEIDNDHWKNELDSFNMKYNVLFSHSDSVLNEISESLAKKMNSNSDINQIMNESFSQIADTVLKSQTFIIQKSEKEEKTKTFISGISYKDINSIIGLLESRTWYTGHFLNSLFGYNRQLDASLSAQYHLSMFSIDKYKTYLENPYIVINNTCYINIFLCPDRHPILYNDFKNVHSVYLEKECYMAMIKLKKNNYSFNDNDSDSEFKLNKSDQQKLKECKILINKQLNIVSIHKNKHLNLLIKDNYAEFILLIMLIEKIQERIEADAAFQNEIIHYTKSTITFTSDNWIYIKNVDQPQISCYIDDITDIERYEALDYEARLKTLDTDILNLLKPLLGGIVDITSDIENVENFDDITNMINYKEQWLGVLIKLKLSRNKNRPPSIHLLENILECILNTNSENNARIDELYDTYIAIHANYTTLSGNVDLCKEIKQLYKLRNATALAHDTTEPYDNVDSLYQKILAAITSLILVKDDALINMSSLDAPVSNLLYIFKLNENIKLENIKRLGENLNRLQTYITYIYSKPLIKHKHEKKENIYIECEIDLLNTEFSKNNSYYGTQIIQAGGNILTIVYNLLKMCIRTVWEGLKNIFGTSLELPSEDDPNYLNSLSETFYDTLTSMFQNDIVYLLLSNSKKYFYKDHANRYQEVNISLINKGPISGQFSYIFDFFLFTKHNEIFENLPALTKKITEMSGHIGEGIGTVVSAVSYAVTSLGKGIMTVLKFIAPDKARLVDTVINGLFAALSGILHTISAMIAGLLGGFATLFASGNIIFILIIIALFGAWWITPRLKLPEVNTIYFANRLKEDKLYISEDVYIKVFGKGDNERNLNKLFFDNWQTGILQQDSWFSNLNVILEYGGTLHRIINHIRFACASSDSKDVSLLNRDLIYIQKQTQFTDNVKFTRTFSNELKLEDHIIYTHQSNIILKNYNINLNIIRINSNNKIALINKDDYKKLQIYEKNPQEIIKQVNDKKMKQ